MATPDPAFPASILLVDDHPPNLRVLQAVLSPLGHPTVQAASGEEALARLGEVEFAVILLDIMMPGMDGLETAALVRSHAHGREVPIILMTAGDTPAVEGYAHGAVDVLRKPLDADVLRGKVAVFVELYRARMQVRAQASRLAAQEHLARARTIALLNASLDAIIGLDHTGSITEFNRVAETTFGRRRDEVLGAPMAELLLPERSREHWQGLSRYLATEESRALDTRMDLTAMRADGTEFPIQLAIRRVPADGAPTFLGYVDDLTAHHQAEKARTFLAHASEAFASSLEYEATLATVVRLAVPHVADWCSVEIVDEHTRTPARLAVAHVDPTKVALAEQLRRRYPHDPESQQGVPHVLRTGQSELYEDIPDALVERAARDAEHLAILRQLGLRSAMIVPITTLGRTFGAITFVATESSRRYGRHDLAMAEDLARRAAMAIENARLYRAAQAAEARNRFLAEATEALASSLDYGTTLDRVTRLAVPRLADSAALYQLERDGAIRLVALAALTDLHEALSRELDQLLPLRIEQQDRLLPRVMRTGRAEMLAELPRDMRKTWSPTTRAGDIVRQLGFHSYMVVPVVVRAQVLGGLALTTCSEGRRFDADDLALAEELARRAGLAIENAQLYQEAQEANRIKDEFLATVSHELRTPLTAILGWLHLLRNGRPEQVRRAIDTIERNAHSQARIVEDILDVSRIVSGKLLLQLERLELGNVLHAAIDTVRATAEQKRIDLVVSIDPSALGAGGETTGDPARLQQIVWNLLSNAIKFTPNGGRVELRLERVPAGHRLSVEDNGQGIRADFLPHVFERFRQADSAPTRAYGGLGLGLAIVRHLVELHGGHVAVESPGEGRGATFTVVLPLPSLAPVEDAPPPRSSANGSTLVPLPRALDGLRILVVDDDADGRDFIVAVLDEHGALVTAASSASMARDELAKATPDVLISDIGMPGEDGYALIGQVRALGVEHGFWFPALALTAYAQASDRNRALSAGYQAHLTKPIVPDALVSAVAKLAGHTSSS
jgi:PAS domain S-box-containing protein